MALSEAMKSLRLISLIAVGAGWLLVAAPWWWPGVVGGKPGKFALMSEVCGVDSAIPDRDKSTDIFPMKYDMVIIAPGAREVKVWNQLHG